MASIDLSKDIYFNDKYLELYLNDNDEVFNFEYIENSKKFISKSIKRPIYTIGKIIVDDGYYDLETAYGYGGYYTNSNDSVFLDKALKKYVEKCSEERVIAEFIRFHPFNTFPVKNADFLDFNIRDREVVVFNLKEEILPGYKSKVRSIIKRSLAEVEISESCNIDKFMELYDLTMKKNNAEKFYYFDRNMYIELMEIDQVRLYEVRYKNEVVAMAFFMFSDDFVHYHLSANSDESYRINTNYALIHRLFEISKKENRKYFILGGGVTSSDNDPLFKFKKKFSRETRSFYIGGKIHNNDAYQQYCKLWEEQTNKNQKYFLKYRLAV